MVAEFTDSSSGWQGGSDIGWASKGLASSYRLCPDLLHVSQVCLMVMTV